MKRQTTKIPKKRKLELGKERVRDLTKTEQQQIAAGNVVQQQYSDTNNTGICITTS